MEETLALFDRVSMAALEMTTRRTELATATLREQTGVQPSPAMAAILALLDEMSAALDAGLDTIDAWDYERRMAALLEQLRRESGGQ
ncbi:MAG: hypothetical protein M3Q10_12465 [Chloroflexota bacterium]|nr:hypothetical protein [Chloroflexota bacterium]